MDQVAWCRIPEKSIPDLLCDPCGGRVGGDVEVDDVASVMVQQDQDVEYLEEDCWHGE
ncbi:MAG: hypothetical protein HQL07_04055 [Nitrospirae bacterium]|nr:hypothetical protein [Magnetococcales bacterium]